MTSIKNLTSIPAPASRPTPVSVPKGKGVSSPAAANRVQAQQPNTFRPGATTFGTDVDRIIETLRTTFLAGKTIANNASTQAQADRSQGTGMSAGLKHYAGRVSNALSLYQRNAMQSGMTRDQARELTLHQLGAMLQGHTFNLAHDKLVEGAMTSTGLSRADLQGRHDLDLVIDIFRGPSTPAAVNTPATVPGPTVAHAGGNVPPAATDPALATGGTASDVLGLMGAAYSMYQIFDNWGKSDPITGAVTGFTAGSYLGSAIWPGVGTAVGGIVGGILGLAGGLLKTGKSQAQLARDQVRALMQNNGMINENWELSLAGGAVFDIGKDGGFKLTNVDGTTTRRAFEVDFSNPLAGDAVGMMQPLAFLLTGGDPVLSNQFTGYFTNAILSNAKDLEGAKQNGLAILQSMKVEPEKLAQGIAEMAKQGRIPEETAKAYINGLTILLSGAAAAQEEKPKAA